MWCWYTYSDNNYVFGSKITARIVVYGKGTHDVTHAYNNARMLTATKQFQRLFMWCLAV